VAVVQATARHRGALEDEGLVHQALGATRRDLRLASAVALTIPAMLAGLGAAIGGTAAGKIGPIGAISNYEPNVGWAPNVSVVCLGAALTSATMLIAAVVAATPRRAESATLLRRERRVVAWLGRFGGRPPIAAGLRFALDPGRGARSVPVRSAITGAVIGVVAVVAGSVFIASLGRLIDSPARAGLPYDVLISNSSADVRDEVLLEPGVGAVAEVSVASFEIEGRSISVHAVTPARGRVDIDLVAGRLPRTPDEITLGLRIAAELGVGLGDTVTARDRQGRPRELGVVGVGVVPVLNGEQLGMNALLTPAGQQAVAVSEPFDSLAVMAAPGTDPRELGERLAERYEAGPGATPTEVDNLDQLGSLPALVAVLLGLIGLIALAHAMILLVRRRQVDLALLQAIGLERRQIRAVVVTAAITVGAIGVLVGIPLGLAAGSTLWRLTATGAFVAPDPLLRWWVLVAAAGATGVVSTIAALLPAQRASRIAPVVRLRRE